MKNLIAPSAGVLLAASIADAEPISAGSGELMSSIPASSLIVTDSYSQTVYGRSDNKVRKRWTCWFPATAGSTR